MTVESATYISQLVPANPASSDNISEGDDQNFLAIVDNPFIDDVRGKFRERPCLSAAGHRGDSHCAFSVFQNFFLIVSWFERSHAVYMGLSAVDL